MLCDRAVAGCGRGLTNNDDDDDNVMKLRTSYRPVVETLCLMLVAPEYYPFVFITEPFSRVGCSRYLRWSCSGEFVGGCKHAVRDFHNDYTSYIVVAPNFSG